MTTDNKPILVTYPVAHIARDEKFQVRSGLNEGTVRRYEGTYRSGKSMPPVTIAEVDGVPILVDGWHRIAAQENLGRARVEAQVFKATREEAMWMAAQANLEHGLPLKRGELREVFRAYVRSKQHRHPGGNVKSYREMATELGRPLGTIYNWMRQDFPRVAAELAGLEGGPGGLPDHESEQRHVAEARRRISQLVKTFQSTSDPSERGTIIEALEAALGDMKGSGNWDPSEY